MAGALLVLVVLAGCSAVATSSSFSYDDVLGYDYDYFDLYPHLGPNPWFTSHCRPFFHRGFEYIHNRRIRFRPCPYLPAVESVPTEKPTIPTEKPTIPTEKPTIPTEKPTIPTEKPTIPTEKPTIDDTDDDYEGSGDIEISIEEQKNPAIVTAKPTIPTAKPTINYDDYEGSGDIEISIEEQKNPAIVTDEPTTLTIRELKKTDEYELLVGENKHPAIVIIPGEEYEGSGNIDINIEQEKPKKVYTHENNKIVRI